MRYTNGDSAIRLRIKKGSDLLNDLFEFTCGGFIGNAKIMDAGTMGETVFNDRRARGKDVYSFCCRGRRWGLRGGRSVGMRQLCGGRGGVVLRTCGGRVT